MIIRPEEKQDFNEIYTVVKAAFATAEHSDGNEQDLVIALRTGNNYIQKLSLVAKIDNQLVGYIISTLQHTNIIFTISNCIKLLSF